MDQTNKAQNPTLDGVILNQSDDSLVMTKSFPSFIPTGRELKVIAKYWLEYDLTERLKPPDSYEILGNAVQEYARRRLDEISNLLSDNLVQHLAAEIQTEYQDMYGEEIWDTLIRGINEQIRTLKMVRRRISEKAH